ncbi:MAG: hypothetical protein GVY36_02855 [Verrucomicrobia bacterium]|jgi:hypothetical protein|nr:hypothetical protein [Verrucomicrobiota bacterium]
MNTSVSEKARISSSEEINAFLEYGYLPESEISISPNILWAARQEEVTENLVKHGVTALKSAFASAVKETPINALHVLPLSGGLDSRTILAALLEHVDPSRIQTVTFGIPGTYDFELGQRVASRAGVNSRVIDLNEFDWSEQELLSCAKKCKRPTLIFERAINAYAWDQFSGDNVVYWSGYMGDPLAGGHLPVTPIDTWEKSLERFALNNRAVASNLTSNEFDPLSVLPKEPLDEGLEFVEQLDFGVRQPCYIKPTVINPGAQTPFLREEWVSFILRVPRRQRVRRRLYKDIVTAAYPNLFSIPTEASQGLKITAPRWQVEATRYAEAIKRRVLKVVGIRSLRRTTNYLDFEVALRKEMKPLIIQQLRDLKDRGIVEWIDVGDIWKKHLAGKDLTDEIHVLVSLEFFLKAQDATSSY